MQIIFTFPTFLFNLFSFFRRKVFIRNIAATDLVLDVGSGDKPFWRADVVVDKFLTDNQQRSTGQIIYDQNKIFVEGDVEKLPFKDKIFDFVFCSHLLEHVENPEKAITELIRVAKKGYIEVPRAISDFLQPFPSHLWYCEYLDNTLIFFQREMQKNFFLRNTEAFGSIIYNNPLFAFLLSRKDAAVFISFYWREKIKYKIFRAKSPYRYTYKEKNIHTKGLTAKFSFLLYKVSYIVMTTGFYKKKNIVMQKILKKNYSNETYK